MQKTTMFGHHGTNILQVLDESKEKERERETDIYIYIYIYMQMYRYIDI